MTLSPVHLVPSTSSASDMPIPMSVTAFAADSSGTLYVADTYRLRITAVGRDGSVRWQHAVPVSRQGNSVSAMGVAEDAVVYVDRLAQRVVFLDRTTGAVLGDVREGAMSTAPFKNGQPLRAGRGGAVVFGLGNILPEPDPKYRLVPATEEFLAEVNGPRAQEAVKRLSLPRLPGILVPLEEGGEAWGYRPPLVPRLVWTPNPFGGWTGGDGYAYHLTVTDSLGDPLRELARDVGPREPSTDGRRREMAFLEAVAKSYPSVRPGDLRADTIGHFSSLVYSVDGRDLWVGRTHLEAYPTYDVWRDGSYQCSVTLDMGEKAGMSLRTPPFIVNQTLYHLAETEDYKSPVVAVFDVEGVCSGASSATPDG